MQIVTVQRLSKNDRSFLLSGVPLLGMPSSASIPFGIAAFAPEVGGRASCIGPPAFAGFVAAEEKAAKSPKSSSSSARACLVDAGTAGTAELARGRPNGVAGETVATGAGPPVTELVDEWVVKSPKSSSSDGVAAGETFRLAPGNDGGGGSSGGATVEPVADVDRASGRKT